MAKKNWLDEFFTPMKAITQKKGKRRTIVRRTPARCDRCGKRRVLKTKTFKGGGYSELCSKCYPKAR